MSALAIHRIPIGRTIKMLIAWVFIFGAAFVLFTLRDDFTSLGRHILIEARGGAVEDGRTLRIALAPDGHFWVDGAVNGEPVRFLVDSGATTTSLSVAAAQRSGVETGGGFPTLVQTANGVVKVERARADTLRVGPIVREDVGVHVSQAFGDMNVLGMNFLSSLAGWGVEGRWLILKT